MSLAIFHRGRFFKLVLLIQHTFLGHVCVCLEYPEQFSCVKNVYYFHNILYQINYHLKTHSNMLLLMSKFVKILSILPFVSVT